MPNSTSSKSRLTSSRNEEAPPIAAKRQRVAVAEDVIILDPQRPVCLHLLCLHLPFETAAGVDRTERVDVGDVGKHAASRFAPAIRALGLQIFGWTLACAGITLRSGDARLDAASSDVSV